MATLYELISSELRVHEKTVLTYCSEKEMLDKSARFLDSLEKELDSSLEKDSPDIKEMIDIVTKKVDHYKTRLANRKASFYESVKFLAVFQNRDDEREAYIIDRYAREQSMSEHERINLRLLNDALRTSKKIIKENIFPAYWNFVSNNFPDLSERLEMFPYVQDKISSSAVRFIQDEAYQDRMIRIFLGDVFPALQTFNSLYD